MSYVFFAATLAVLVIMGLALARAFVGPGIYDRILAVNMFGTKTVLFIALYGFLTDRPEFLDIALVYTLINFIGVIAVLNFVKDTLEKDKPLKATSSNATIFDDSSLPSTTDDIAEDNISSNTKNSSKEENQ